MMSYLNSKESVRLSPVLCSKGCQSIVQVMLLDAPLDGSMAEEMDGKSGSSRRRVAKRERIRQAAADFLDHHSTAKIVVVVDTHCLEETGGFIYGGDAPESYESCHMVHVSIPCLMHCRSPCVPYLTHVQIISECIPRGVRRFLSNSDNSEPHTHRSIIFNLACGASIRNGESRYSLFEG